MPSTGGASGLGIDSENHYGLVYKATGRTGGIYKTMSHLSGSHHQYVPPMHVKSILRMRKYITPDYVKVLLKAKYIF